LQSWREENSGERQPMSVAEEKFFRAPIVERRDIAEDLWSIRVAPGGEFIYKPGQYATLGVITPQKHIERAYSIASAPHDNLVEFFLELVPQGELTPLLHQLKKGDTLTCRKVAKGRFTLDTASGRTNHLLLATVTGIAPFVSYVRTLYQQWKDGQFPAGHNLYLIDGASRSWEFGYRAEIEPIAAEVPWLKYISTISRPWEDAAWKGEMGRVDDLVRKYSDSWGLAPQSTSVYLCGHPMMVETCKSILQRRGWQKEAMREEVYFIPSKQA
jgi:ferredoxin--NADP+ reductase